MPFVRMERNKCMYSCDVCEQDFQFGPHRYDGAVVPELGSMLICFRCVPESHWDRPAAIPGLRARLAARGKIK
jgi:hypothetical protein